MLLSSIKNPWYYGIFQSLSKLIAAQFHIQNVLITIPRPLPETKKSMFFAPSISCKNAPLISFALEAIVSLLGFDSFIIPERGLLLKENNAWKMPNLQGISGFFYAGFLPGSTSFLFCFEGFWLVNINPEHQPVKLPPGKIPDLWLLSGPLITAADRQSLIDQNEAIRFAEQGFDPVPSSSASEC